MLENNQVIHLKAKNGRFVHTGTSRLLTAKESKMLPEDGFKVEIAPDPNLKGKDLSDVCENGSHDDMETIDLSENETSTEEKSKTFDYDL